nr:hypothetical protein Iba_chr11bCG13620 [Ipomoea batatas]
MTEGGGPSACSVATLLRSSTSTGGRREPSLLHGERGRFCRYREERRSPVTIPSPSRAHHPRSSLMPGTREEETPSSCSASSLAASTRRCRRRRARQGSPGPSLPRESDGLSLLPPESYGCCLATVGSKRGRTHCRGHRDPIAVDGGGHHHRLAYHGGRREGFAWGAIFVFSVKAYELLFRDFAVWLLRPYSEMSSGFGGYLEETILAVPRVVSPCFINLHVYNSV